MYECVRDRERASEQRQVAAVPRRLVRGPRRRESEPQP